MVLFPRAKTPPMPKLNKDSRSGWTREPMPAHDILNPKYYFVAELHKGEWTVMLEDDYFPLFKPNKSWLMRWSEPVVFPGPPKNKEEEP